MIRRPPRSTHCISSAASDVYKRQESPCKASNMSILLPNIQILTIQSSSLLNSQAKSKSHEIITKKKSIDSTDDKQLVLQFKCSFSSERRFVAGE
eukprot:TRINITY_DN8008_c0_g1_i2.p2 TRINITY_DN8008_c0_g1~~TRINITY_DN8008_c0_g1_i2.p2  ORF type:complete len:103 (-),score=34.80 TRINITY_DN8008_c0_g1_i2:559-843(-)